MLGEQVSMNQALVVTIFSMTIVFLALLAISFILDIFRITLTEDKKKKKELQPELIIDEIGDDKETEEELVAVITAVLAKELGNSVENFIVKNIIRIPDTESAWTKAGRLELMR